MSLAEFLRRLDLAQLSDNDRKWFPKWLAGYTQHHRLSDQHIPIEESLVLSFLRSLRDSRRSSSCRWRGACRRISWACPRAPRST